MKGHLKVKVGGPLAHQWDDGTIDSWTGAVLQVDANDIERVEFFRQIAAAGLATILEDTITQDAPPPPVAPRKATMAVPAAQPRDGGTN